MDWRRGKIKTADLEGAKFKKTVSYFLSPNPHMELTILLEMNIDELSEIL